MPANTPFAPLQEAEDFLQQHPDIEMFELFILDNNGVPRGKLLHRDELLAVYQSGRPLPSTILGLTINGDDVENSGLVWDVGDIDCRAYPLSGSLQPMPWRQIPTAAVQVSMHPEQGLPATVADPRQLLVKVIDGLKADGYYPVMAAELEFYLLDQQRDSNGRPQPARDADGGRPRATQVYGLRELEQIEPFLADLLASVNDGKIPRGSIVKVLDIGMGANCVYPLIGYMEYRWNFLGSEVDPIAVAAAKAIVQSNDLSKVIQLRQQPNPKQILLGLLEPGERFDLTMCNPPFHASMDEATKGSERKWRALGKADPKRKLPVLNFGGQSAELWCEGGEARFVTQLIAESAHFAHKVLWFSTLVSKASNLPAIETALKKAGVLESQVVEMSQGQKQSRFVAWTFQTKNEQQIWRQRWVRD